MNSYLYIQALFKAILQQSKKIEGRLVMLPKGGAELNSDDFDQVMTEVSKDQKYPLCAMMPPRSEGLYGKDNEWEDYVFELYFLNTTYYNSGNQVAKKNPNTATSSKSVVEEWEQMKVSAIDFMRVLQLVQKGKNSDEIIMLNNLFRLDQGKKFIHPVSFIGQNRLSGVRLSFNAELFISCEIEDYEGDFIIALPTL